LETFDRVVERAGLLYEFVDVCFLRGNHGVLWRGCRRGWYEVRNPGEDRRHGM
jgi:hypothetical protein